MSRNGILLITILILLIVPDCHSQYVKSITLVNTKQKKIFEEDYTWFDSIYNYSFYEKIGYDSCSVKVFKRKNKERNFIIDSLKNIGYDTNVKILGIHDRVVLTGKVLKYGFYKFDTARITIDTPNKYRIIPVYVFDMEYTIKVSNPKIIKHFYSYHITTASSKKDLSKWLKKFPDFGYTIFYYEGVDIYRLGIVYDYLYHFVNEKRMEDVLAPSNCCEDFF